MIYANENDPHAAHWLTCLPLRIDHVDDRSILEVKGTDLEKYNQCHFFAGIGGWPLAFEMAGWPIDVPVWSGSCPCQPFSTAGKRKGTADERHLWPEFLRLIAECKPPTIFGEQVASKAGREWLAVVRDDLEALGYAVGAADLCAASVGAPHIRQRLFWVADRSGSERQWWSESEREQRQPLYLADGSSNGGLADAKVTRGGGYVRVVATKTGPTRAAQHGRQDGDEPNRCSANGRVADARQQPPWASDARKSVSENPKPHERRAEAVGESGRCSSDLRLGDTESDGWQQGWPGSDGRNAPTTDGGMGNATSERCGETRESESHTRPADVLTHSGWADVEFINCRDGKARPVKPGIRCLDHGIPGRVAQLRGLGNAIVPQVAAAFIAAFMETKPHQDTE